jgi:hypothetical protein
MIEIQTPEAVGEPNAQKGPRPRVVERYWEYTPPFNATTVVERMLESVPPRYLFGLKEVVLTNKAGLSRKRRRSVSKSRGRKVKQAEARGLYHAAWKGQQAWIEIFVDNTLNFYQKRSWRWLLHLGFFRESDLGGVLFHEIGHHIDATIRPEFREKEDIADDWSIRLRRAWFRNEHPLLKKVLRLFVPILRFLSALLAGRLLTRGEWSRAKYERHMKDIRSHK